MKKQNLFYLICGILMFVSEVWKQWCLTFFLNDGVYQWWYFPFQLCSIPMYICLLVPFIKHPSIASMLRSFLMTFTLLSGICTFFDTSGLSYPYLPLTIHSYVWHMLLIFIGLFTGYFGRKRCSFTDFVHSILFFLATCIIATCINMTIHPFGKINMFYMSPYYKMSQILFCDISESIGNLPAIACYIFSIVLGATFLHLLWRQSIRYKV